MFQSDQLLSDCTFATFVQGTCNADALEAARSVVEGPGQQHNPLLIHAGPGLRDCGGLGASHLLQAIGHAMLEVTPAAKMRFIAAETFLKHFTTAARMDQLAEFRDHYRTADILLIRDLQFLEYKERTQVEMFETIRDVLSRNKQVAVSSNCSARAMAGLSEQLQNLLSSGRSVSIHFPDLMTRKEILASKARQQAQQLPDDVALLLAQQSYANVREMLNCLSRVSAQCRLEGVPLTLEFADRSLRRRSVIEQ